ncbi:TlpA family protein disulfide reductase [Bradymonas sediminis]|nr:TlpA disulfide reductase family protein [Bradymonas sediminis]TDP76573.1 AhpC/TSA family protein [Bradymonas sediminis]
MRHAFLLICILGSIFAASTALAGVKVGDAPQVESQTAHATPFDLKEQRGKVVLVEFWATWCGPCRKALPVYSKLVDAYDGKFVVAAVSIDGDRADMLRFMDALLPQARTQQGFNILWEKKHPLASQFGPPSIPTGYLIDPKGVVREVYTGFDKGSEAQLKKDIERLLSQPKSSAQKK